MASVLVSLLFAFTVSAAPLGFSDLQDIPDFATYPIQKLVEKGVLKGNSDGTFKPARPVNRAEFCKMLVLATGAKKYIPIEPSFPDVHVDDWFFEYVETARHHGWVNGYPDGNFRPGNKINRAEIAKILVLAFDLEPDTGIDNTQIISLFDRLHEKVGGMSDLEVRTLDWNSPDRGSVITKKLDGFFSGVSVTPAQTQSIEKAIKDFFNEEEFVREEFNTASTTLSDLISYENDDLICRTYAYIQGSLAAFNKGSVNKGFEVHCAIYDPELESEEWFKKYERALSNSDLAPHGMEHYFHPAKNPERSEISEQIFRFMKKTGRISPFDLADAPQESFVKEMPKMKEPDLPVSPPDSSFAPQVETPVLNDYSGTLYISKSKSDQKRLQVISGQQGVRAMGLDITSKEGDTKLSFVQFRRIGNGGASDYTEAWLELDGEAVSSRISITDDLVSLPLNNWVVLKEGTNHELVLRVSLNDRVKVGNSSRFVLYLPEWIGADTDGKVGFFPFGGTDMDVKQ